MRVARLRDGDSVVVAVEETPGVFVGVDAATTLDCLTRPVERTGAAYTAVDAAALSFGNDVSSRDIEGANPLYLPQAKVYAGACAIGPALLLARSGAAPLFEIILTIYGADGGVLFTGGTSTSRMRRTFDDLVGWLMRDNPVPPGTVLLTGTGVVPPDDYTLLPGHRVEIHVPGIGTLVNHLALAGSIGARREPPR